MVKDSITSGSVGSVLAHTFRCTVVLCLLEPHLCSITEHVGAVSGVFYAFAFRPLVLSELPTTQSQIFAHFARFSCFELRLCFVVALSAVGPYHPFDGCIHDGH